MNDFNVYCIAACSLAHFACNLNCIRPYTGVVLYFTVYVGPQLRSEMTASTSTGNMTLAMSCDDDSLSQSTSSTGPSMSWLEMKKAHKVRFSTRPTDRERLSKELDDYMNEANEPEDCNPLDWWSRSNSLARFPTVALVARAYLAIPATSVASERLFSKCGLVISDRRASLNPAHVEQIVFLSQNL